MKLVSVAVVAVLLIAILVTTTIIVVSASKHSVSGNVAEAKRKDCPEKNEENRNYRSAILFKTHKWNDMIELRFQKIRREAQGLADVYLLLQGDQTGECKEQGGHVVRISDAEMRSVYRVGFVNAWLSNHWLMMSWWKRVGRVSKYEYVWSVEYDVGMLGDSSILWKVPSSADLLASHGPFQHSNWAYKDDYTCQTKCMTDEDKWYGYVQVSRYSAKFLDYMDQTFESGENGQDEMMIFSLAKRGNFTIETQPIKCLQKFWSVLGADADAAKQAFDKEAGVRQRSRHNEGTNSHSPHHSHSLSLYHPIKG
jgi:hypothetical protein